MHLINVFFLIFFTATSFSQEYLAPDIKESFGNNSHTNRDVPYFSEIDYQGNIIVVGTTERDSTFTDLITMKLDANLNLLWQKQYSFQKNRDNGPFHFSYDTPKSMHIDQNGNIYVSGICQNRNPDPMQSYYMVKYNASGDELWHIDFPYSTNTINPGAGYAESFFENNELHVVYSLVNEQNTGISFTFYTINTDGQIVDSYVKNELEDNFNSNFTGIDYKFYYKNHNFYMVYRRNNVTMQPYFYEHFIKKINASSVMTYALNPIIDFADTNYFSSGNLLIGQDDAIYWGYNSNNLANYRIIKFNALGNLMYNISPPVGVSKRIVHSFLNASGNLCILNRNLIAGNLTFNLTQFDANGTIVSDIATAPINVIKVKIASDYSIMVYNGINLKLFDTSLNLINTFALDTSPTNDFCKVNDDTIIRFATTQAQMYPNSDSYTQQNILVQKLNPASVQQQYTYSGIGTSMSYGARMLIDHDDNIFIVNVEKYGEAPLSSSGVQPPSKNRIIKYDSDLSMLWQLEITETITSSILVNNFFIDADNNFYAIGHTSATTFKLIKISSSGELIYSVPCNNAFNSYIDQDGNINLINIVDYLTAPYDLKIETINPLSGALIDTHIFPGQSFFKEFKYNGHSRLYLYQKATQSSEVLRILAYDDLNFVFSTDLNATGTFMDAGSPTIDDMGNLFFMTATISSGQPKLNKITPSGIYTYNAIALGLTTLTTTTNNKLFTLNNDGKIRIYDNALNLLTESTESYSYDYVSLMTMGNYMLLNTNYTNTVQVVDENAQTVTVFKVPSTLAPFYGAKDSTEKLVIAGTNSGAQFMSGLYWSRGFLHKYDIPSYLDTGGGLPDSLDSTVLFYPNPTDSFINITNAKNVIRTEVYDLTGRFIKASSSARIDISDCLPAVYLLKAYLNDGVVSSTKIVKK